MIRRTHNPADAQPRPVRMAIAAVAAFATVVALAGVLVPSAGAAPAPAPRFLVSAFSMPTHFATTDAAPCEESYQDKLAYCDSFRITATNVGSLETTSPTVLSDTLPAGLVVRSVQLFWSGAASVELGNTAGGEFGLAHGDCNGETVPVHCEYPEGLAPGAWLEMVVNVGLAGATGGSNTVEASGGGALPATGTTSMVVDDTPAAFGPNLSSAIAGLDGAPDTEAGAHPAEMTTFLAFNSDIRRGVFHSKLRSSEPNGSLRLTSVQDVRDVAVDLPLGFLGSARAASQCTFVQLEAAQSGADCPQGSKVGFIVTRPEGIPAAQSGLYNMVPDHGVAAAFGFDDNIPTAHEITASLVPTPEGYVLRATSADVTQIELTNAMVTLYGDPAAADASGFPPTAMLTNPSDCNGRPLVTSAYADSWQNPGSYNPDGTPALSDPRWASTADEAPPVTGCDRLSFAPESFAFQPETSAADAATGMAFDLRLPQPEQPNTLATPPLRDATVTLPAGVIVNPAAAGGLASCSVAQIGWQGPVSASNPGLTNFNASPPACPKESEIGSVELTTPLLAGTLTGSVYLAAQDENPFHSLLAGYIVVNDPTTGVVVKIPGKLRLNEQTGQITGVFDENPQLPFSDLKLRFFGGARGELATPEACGTYTTTGELEPWSAPQSGPNALVSDSFPIDTGCTPGFTPAFTAGATSTQAGAYSPFTFTLSRQDSEQELSGVTVSLPPGLEGKLAGVEECSQAQIAAATANPSGAAERAHPECPAGSRIGTVTSTAGVGTEPLTITGNAYLTGPYNGAPYGIVVVDPAIAGPFDLGTVVVRAALHIDPNDAHVTAVSDPFPTILDRQGDGLPIRLRSITVTMDRPGFTLNPTSCSPMTIDATATSTRGVSAAVSSPFQAAGCRELPFHPVFTASTPGAASRSNGASLKVRIAAKQGPDVKAGEQEANIRKVDVQLPGTLPSRLSTLQKACTEHQFAAAPAGCPAGSVVGTAVAHTPLLSVPLEGPAILVSHGGAAFPDLVLVLQGNGIRVDLTGHTNIAHGITYSNFETAPDAPFTSFELILPEGPHSVLGAYRPNGTYDLCGLTRTTTTTKRVTERVGGRLRKVTVKVKHVLPMPLLMPTTITAQNGAVVKQDTRVAVTGCPSAAAARKAAARKARRARRATAPTIARRRP